MTQEEVLEAMVNRDPLYIVDCENFIYYVKQVYVEGYEISSREDQIVFIVTGEQRQCAYSFYKNKKECQKIVDKYNNNPTNKKRAEDWNSVETQKQLLELREIAKEINNIN